MAEDNTHELIDDAHPRTVDVAPHDDERLEGKPALVLRAVYSYKWLGLAAVLAAALTGYFAAATAPPAYEATADLLLRGTAALPGQTSSQAVDPERYLSNEAAIARSRRVLQRVTEELGANADLEELREQLEITASTDADVLRVTATAPTAEQAARIANALATAYLEVSRQEEQEVIEALAAELQRLTESVQQQIDTVQQELSSRPRNAALLAERDNLIAQRVSLQVRQQDALADAAAVVSGGELLEPAIVPATPAAPIPARSALVAAALTVLLFAAGAAWRAERSLPALRSSDAASVLHAPLLAELSAAHRWGTSQLVPDVQPEQPEATDIYRFLQAAIRQELARHGGTTVVFTSVADARGRSRIALNVAVAAGRSGQSVVLVDADERTRELSTSLGAGKAPGLGDVMNFDRGLETCLAPLVIDDAALDRRRVKFVPVGSTVGGSTTFFSADRFRHVVERLRGNAGFVLIDGPSLAAGSAAVVAKEGDGAMVVVRHGDSLRLLAQLREQLDLLAVPLLGYTYIRGGTGDLPFPSSLSFEGRGNGKQRGQKALSSEY